MPPRSGSAALVVDGLDDVLQEARDGLHHLWRHVDGERAHGEARWPAGVPLRLHSLTAAQWREHRDAPAVAKLHPALRAVPANATSRIEWAPVRGGVSADGAHGFTFGYMTQRRADGTRAPLKYLAYWVRRPEGWRVAVYRRVRRPDADAPTATP